MADIFHESKLLALTQKTGYNIVQENGQRKYGPPPGWIGSPPPKGSEIFIGKLPRDVFEHELVPLCEQFGKIYELRLMMDYNGENRGYAFVTYTNNDDASKAIKGLDDYEIRPNRHIGVCKSVDNCRLFIGGIPKDKTKEEIELEMSRYTEGVSKVILYSCIVDKTKSRGFAFVEYESHRAAAMARRKLIAGNIKLFEHEIAVDWAQPEAQVEDETMKRVKVLYVRNLSPVTTEDTLQTIFSMSGVLRVERVKKMRDFAFVHYCKREDAENALQKFDGIVVDGCTLEVTWAKPPDSQKQRSPTDKKLALNSLYRQLNYESLDHSLDFPLFQATNTPNGIPILNRPSLKARLPGQSISGLRTVTRPVQLLNYICLENGWGEPVYHVSYIDNDPWEVYFVCSVSIPGFPIQNRKLMSDKLCSSPEEAKFYAACFVLRKLGITDIETPNTTSIPALNGASSFANYSNKSYPSSNGSGCGAKSDIDFPMGGMSTPHPYSGLSKNFSMSNGVLSTSRSVPSLGGMCSTPKCMPPLGFKSPMSASPFFGERGQGDATASFSSGGPGALDGCNFDDLDNCPPLWDPDTPIEPTSILGVLASMFVTENELPNLNKPKL